jgi:hypothetical protein
MSYSRNFLLALVGCMILALAACSGPTSTSQAQPGQPAQSAQPAAAANEPAPAAAPVPDEPRTRVVHAADTPKRPVREAPKNVVKETPRPEPSPVQTTASASPVTPPTLNLPAPVPPPVAVPAPPPDDVKEVKPEPVEPTTRQVRVPSGTLVSIRMIDSVDSGTDHVGQSFKASLESPIIVDNDTVFPKGAEAYVKLAKVESAGRLSGRSELQLQLDRIFLGKTSYRVESNTFTNTGSSQTAKTAKTAGIGAAIGAVIGGIAGGGKGAVIGGATGAGAGVGVEAISKGEQVRVDSETRLDFRLESPLDVTVQNLSPANSSPRHNPSGPLRFGTRQ